MHPES
jgi:hypothetical protein